MALTFQNPTQKKGTLRLEPIPKHLATGNRPIMYLRKNKNKEAFEAYWKLYEQIRGNSEEQKRPADNHAIDSS